MTPAVGPLRTSASGQERQNASEHTGDYPASPNALPTGSGRARAGPQKAGSVSGGRSVFHVLGQLMGRRWRECSRHALAGVRRGALGLRRHLGLMVRPIPSIRTDGFAGSKSSTRMTLPSARGTPHAACRYPTARMNAPSPHLLNVLLLPTTSLPTGSSVGRQPSLSAVIRLASIAFLMKDSNSPHRPRGRAPYRFLIRLAHLRATEGGHVCCRPCARSSSRRPYSEGETTRRPQGRSAGTATCTRPSFEVTFRSVRFASGA